MLWRALAYPGVRTSTGAATIRWREGRSRAENNDDAAITDSFYALTRNATTFAPALPSQ
jgi:hypothetical protein